MRTTTTSQQQQQQEEAPAYNSSIDTVKQFSRMFVRHSIESVLAKHKQKQDEEQRYNDWIKNFSSGLATQLINKSVERATILSISNAQSHRNRRYAEPDVEMISADESRQNHATAVRLHGASPSIKKRSRCMSTLNSDDSNSSNNNRASPVKLILLSSATNNNHNNNNNNEDSDMTPTSVLAASLGPALTVSAPQQQQQQQEGREKQQQQRIQHNSQQQQQQQNTVDGDESVKRTKFVHGSRYHV